MLCIDLTQLGSASAASDGELVARVQRVSGRTNEIASDVHQLSHRLHPARLARARPDPGPGGAVPRHSRQHRTLVEFEYDELRERLDPDVALCLYRVTQEALHNVVRHSGAQHATVRLNHRGEQVSLQVADDGAGFALRDREGTGGSAWSACASASSFSAGRSRSTLRRARVRGSESG